MSDEFFDLSNCKKDADDYIVTLRLKDGGFVSVRVPREDSQNSFCKTVGLKSIAESEEDAWGLNRVTKGHYL